MNSKQLSQSFRRDDSVRSFTPDETRKADLMKQPAHVTDIETAPWPVLSLYRRVESPRCAEGGKILIFPEITWLHKLVTPW